MVRLANQIKERSLVTVAVWVYERLARPINFSVATDIVPAIVNAASGVANPARSRTPPTSCAYAAIEAMVIGIWNSDANAGMSVTLPYP